MIGHFFSRTTLDIYLHSTHEMQRLAAMKKDGKRISKTVYAKIKEECEALLAEMIVQTKADIQAAKDKLKSKQTA